MRVIRHEIRTFPGYFRDDVWEFSELSIRPLRQRIATAIREEE